MSEPDEAAITRLLAEHRLYLGRCDCGYGLQWNYGIDDELHRAHVAAVLAAHMADREADAADNSAERKALSFAAYMFALNHPLYGPSTTQAVMDWLNAFKDEHYPFRFTPDTEGETNE